MSQQLELQSLQQRVELLEKQNRRFRFLGLSLLLVTLSVGIIAWSNQTTYYNYHGQFTLRDEHGDARGTLSYTPGTNKGKLMIGRAETDNETNQISWDWRVLIGEDENGNGRIILKNKQGKVTWSSPK